MIYTLTECFFFLLGALILTALWFLCMLFVALLREGLAYLSQALRRDPRPSSPDAVFEFLLPSAPLKLTLTQEGSGQHKR